MAEPELYRLKDGVSENYRSSIEQYVAQLAGHGVPVAFSPEHLCEVIGVDTNYVYAVSNNASPHYRTFHVPKRSGGVRPINEPLPTLKFIQRWMLDNILHKINVNEACKAYTIGRSIKDNARFHRAQNLILKLDVSSFFSSIRINAAFEIFYELGYTKPVSTLLAKLCTLEGVLPQGAPTSGALANIYLKEFDADLLRYCLEKKLRYTRYADDITISGSEIEPREVGDFVANKLAELNLHLNAKKSILVKNSNRMLVTELVVNKKLNLPREFLERIRQEVYFVKKFGIYSHAKKIRRGSPTYVLNALIGRIVFALHVRPYDTQLRESLGKMRLEQGALRAEVGLGTVGEDYLSTFPVTRR